MCAPSSWTLHLPRVNWQDGQQEEREDVGTCKRPSIRDREGGRRDAVATFPFVLASSCNSCAFQMEAAVAGAAREERDA